MMSYDTNGDDDDDDDDDVDDGTSKPHERPGAASCVRLIVPPNFRDTSMQKHVTVATNLFHRRVYTIHVVIEI